MSISSHKLLDKETKASVAQDENGAAGGAFNTHNREEFYNRLGNTDNDHTNENTRIACSSRAGNSNYSWSRENRQHNSNEAFKRGSGLCGLVNPNRICFMNCVVQCLAHCPPLADYFLDDRYMRELNLTNPRGTKGEMARTFGVLLKNMWSGEHKYLLARDFRMHAEKFTNQYDPFQQEFDAQEFLTFVLDNLHEDLNRAKEHKGGITIETEGRPDPELAKETWDVYLKRNDSIIVDLFHGLLRSKLICPNCETVSVKFDPMCFLSLPLPVDKEKVFKILYVPHDQTKNETRYEVKASESSRVRDLLAKLSTWIGCETERLVLAAVSNHHIHKFFSRDDSLEVVNVAYRAGLHVYDIPEAHHLSPAPATTTLIPVYHWEVKSTSDTSVTANNRMTSFHPCLFGTPALISLPTAPLKYETIHSLIASKLSRYIRFTSNINDNRLKSEDDMDIDSENESDKEPPEEAFTLHVVNTKDASSAKRIPNNGQLIKFPEYQGDQCLVLQWTTSSMRKYFKSQTPNQDSSLLTLENKARKLNLQDCLDIFASTEKLESGNTWNCPSCKKPSVGGTKKFDVWTLPNVLIINLKRFSYIVNRHDKLNKKVDYPLENLKLNDYLVNKNHAPVSYNLIGVINHYGGPSEGHYTAFAKNRMDNQWYCFDDSNIHKLKEKDVVTSTAYVLLYMKNDLMKEENQT
ncbi:ubiquitin carboxyl-terminal hydrolase 4 isoform X2 [Nilaparvata lugens]|uniref:ubiquitin carboxyl-terminal hydrolase 4 isoform X1 n=1 Tax=Nilaparvata lugens TaxID=108931 RepID=UPI00193D507D|nr:ubiquitin carboxyl-terminal hydrolase 4 isoform X1 [Nilaparvata lugens]XP_039283678.1 ubiquitin carboxyl-terminal hydrolase 4 isoform X1 [Nilaparvata lugens]XP_039283679.1 ubiquitin carboxyl-terminal hydrolase 4 isoform X2 [Nilaparvata lugens]